MNTKRKILFMDLDDTLLTHDKRLTQENADAITRALEAGHLHRNQYGKAPSRRPALSPAPSSGPGGLLRHHL